MTRALPFIPTSLLVASLMIPLLGLSPPLIRMTLALAMGRPAGLGLRPGHPPLIGAKDVTSIHGDIMNSVAQNSLG